jgi:hypothetical protein
MTLQEKVEQRFKDVMTEFLDQIYAEFRDKIGDFELEAQVRCKISDYEFNFNIECPANISSCHKEIPTIKQ